MELKDFISLLAKKKMIIFVIVFIFLILALILTIIQPFKYGSSAQVLIIQNSASPDPYSASKSTEYLSNILAQVVSSNSFFENVLISGYFIDKNYFGQTVKAQMKTWAETVSAKAVNDSGIIAINIYHKNRAQAELIARAVVYTLQTKHGLYHGNGNNVAIKIIDEPITSNYPVKPNLILNFSLALALGLIGAFIYVYLFPEEKYNIRLSSKFAARKVDAGRRKQPEFAPAVESVEEISLKPEYAFNENLNKTNGDNFNNYDDLDIHEEIAQPGSMKNIFGRPYSDDL